VQGVIELTTEYGRKLSALSQQLRVLHTELADQSAELRQEQLRDEVQRAVSALPPQEREPFLKALKERFPVWSEGPEGSGGGGGDEFAVAASRAASAAAEATLANPVALAQRLVSLCKGLSDSEKAPVMAILAAGGMIPPPRVVERVVERPVERATTSIPPAPRPAAPPVAPPAAPPVAPPAPIATPIATPVAVGGAGAGGKAEGVSLAPGQPLAELRRAMSLPSDAQLDGVRVVEVAAVLAEFVAKLEPWACQYWKAMAPDARNEVPATLSRTMGKFVITADDKATKDQVAREAFRLRSLVSLLMKGVNEAGRQYARDHLARFGIDAITREAKAGWKGQAAANWEVYAKLMEGVDADWIDQRIRKLIASDVDAGLSQVLNR
jgi:hypothetical protein